MHYFQYQTFQFKWTSIFFFRPDLPHSAIVLILVFIFCYPVLTSLGVSWNGGRVDRLHVQDTALISGYSNDSGLSTHEEKKSLVLSCSFFFALFGS